jgi:hypothetical protein
VIRDPEPRERLFELDDSRHGFLPRSGWWLGLACVAATALVAGVVRALLN